MAKRREKEENQFLTDKSVFRVDVRRAYALLYSIIHVYAEGAKRSFAKRRCTFLRSFREHGVLKVLLKRKGDGNARCKLLFGT